MIEVKTLRVHYNDDMLRLVGDVYLSEENTAESLENAGTVEIKRAEKEEE